MRKEDRGLWRIAVTGACGFIGSHLAEELAKRGYVVTAVALHSAQDTHGWLDEIDGPNIRVVRGDVRDATFVRSLLREVDGVYHLAALGGVPYSFDAPHAYLETNVLGTLNILEACRELDIEMIHASTSEVYGNAGHVVIPPEAALAPRSPYAASKAAADQYVIAYQVWALSEGRRVPQIVRMFNVYGPRQSQRALVPSIISQMLAASASGGVVHLGNRLARRDMSYVGDAVAVLADLLSYPERRQVIQIAQGASYSVEEIVETCRDALASLGVEAAVDCRIVYGDEHRSRPDGVEVQRLCGERRLYGAARLSETSFVDGIRKTAEWWLGRGDMIPAREVVK